MPLRHSALRHAVGHSIEGKREKAHFDELIQCEHGRILVVEDNVVNQKVAKRMVEMFGFDVDVAENGIVALACLKKVDYDLVFMDCQMPEMDGYEATSAIRKSEKGGEHTIVVAMTANAMAGDRERCLVAGMDDHLPKPIRKNELKQMLLRWLPLNMRKKEC